MASYIIQALNAVQIEQSVSGAYYNIIVRGSGFIRDTGVQAVSGVKTFYDNIFFNSGLYLTGDLTPSGEIVGLLTPKTDNAYDLGTSLKEWRNLYLDGTGQIDSLLVDESAVVASSLSVGSNQVVSGSSVVAGSSSIGTNSIISGRQDVLGNFGLSGDFAPSGSVIGNLLPKSDNSYDLGSSSFEWRNLYIDGTAQIDTLQVDESASVVGSLSVGNGALITGSVTSTSFSESSSVRTTGSGQFGSLFITGTGIPSTPTSAGTVGQIVWGSGHLYVCTGTNLWGRTHLTGWI